MSGALVLNASYEPLCVVTTRRALMLVLDDKAELVSATDRVALNRRAVFVRDGHRCQYCNAPAENIDHVIPRSKGGPHTWENVVAACRPCNARKMDHNLAETNMHLRRQPRAPRERIWIMAAVGSVRADWEPYLGPSAAAEMPSLSA